jgi:hypothetical protein
MSTKIDLTNRQFGRLKVIKDTGKRCNGHVILECLCKCGKTCEVLQSNLGKSAQSCGCIKTEENKKDCVENTRLRNLISAKRKRKTKDSGIKGVIWDSNRGKWSARIGIQGKNLHLGRFDTIKAAAEARTKAEELYHKPILDKYKR